jgi:hypothetical protein
MKNFSARLRNQTFVAPQDIEEFEDLQAAIAADFAPASEIEAQHVITIIHCLWTIRRTRIDECKMQERAFNDGLVDPILDVQWARQLKGVLDMRRQAERTQIQATKDFHLAVAKRQLQQQPQPEPEPPPSDNDNKPKLRRLPAAAIATTSTSASTANNIISIDRVKTAQTQPRRLDHQPVPIAA